jgi:hypothetical protein
MRSAKPFVYGCKEQIAMNRPIQRSQYEAMLFGVCAVAELWRSCKLVPQKAGRGYHVSTPLFYVFLTSSSLSTPLLLSVPSQLMMGHESGPRFSAPLALTRAPSPSPPPLPSWLRATISPPFCYTAPFLRYLSLQWPSSLALHLLIYAARLSPFCKVRHLGMSACPHVRMSAYPHVRISACPHLCVSVSPHLGLSECLFFMRFRRIVSQRRFLWAHCVSFISVRSLYSV